MDVHLITDDGVRDATVEELPGLLAERRGLVWVDVPHWDDQARQVLTDVFHLHPLAVRDCAVRNRLPKVHAYPDTLFLVLHAPELGEGGHVHLVELDRIVGPGYLITVHGPYNEAISDEVAQRETRAVLERIRSGRLRPRTSFDISHAIVSTLTRGIEQLLDALAAQVWTLEQRVTGAERDDPEWFLDRLFRTRHGLLAVKTLTAQTAEIYRRVAQLSGSYIPPESHHLVLDLVDQFDRLAGLAGEEQEYLLGVIEFYRTRTDTKMTIAAERLAVIAVVTLPITALASVFGMNFIVNSHTRPLELTISLVIMLVMTLILMAWAKRQGWW